MLKPMMLVRYDTLHSFFKGIPQKPAIVYRDMCQGCGVNVVIKIVKHPPGFGMSGGALFEQEPDHLFALCDQCYQAMPNWAGERIMEHRISDISEIY